MKKMLKIFVSISLLASLILVSPTYYLADTQINKVKEEKETKEELKIKLGFKASDFNNPTAKSKLSFTDPQVAELNLTNEDVENLSSLGFTKERITNFTLEDWEAHGGKKGELISVDVTYNEYDKTDKKLKRISKEEFETKKAKELSRKSSDSVITASLCDPTGSTCDGANNSSLVRLTVSVTHSTKYAIVSDFDWINIPNDNLTDFFGSGYNENLTIDFNSIMGSYRATYYDNVGSYKTTRSLSLGRAEYPQPSGYAQKFTLFSEYYQYNGVWTSAKKHGGYTYAEFVWSYGTSASAFTYYTHMETGYSTSWSISIPKSVGISIEGTTKDILIGAAAVSFGK